MKKPSSKARDRLKVLHERIRLGKTLGGPPTHPHIALGFNYWNSLRWIEQNLVFEEDFFISENNEVTLVLPERLNFSTQFDRTAIFLQAIRRLCYVSRIQRNNSNNLRLRSVNFDSIRALSTSAGLVLAAEISRWNDSLPRKLTPLYEGWSKDIQVQLTELGFFELFNLSKPDLSVEKSRIRTIKYLRGNSGQATIAITLREKIEEIIGDTLEKSPFLFQGISEAITNVCEHAYPNASGRKSWYVTGGYDTETRELKIAFYDQGIGIPKSLPTSGLREKVHSYLSAKGLGTNDAALIRAAVEVGRTRTAIEHKGKGLQDLHEFIHQREQGYLSILSQRGLYKFEKTGEETRVKSEALAYPILGTLIIWSVKLRDSA